MNLLNFFLDSLSVISEGFSSLLSIFFGVFAFLVIILYLVRFMRNVI